MKTKTIFFLALTTLAILPLYSFAEAVTPSVSVDMKVNRFDGPIRLPYGSPTTLSWVSTGVTSCVGYQNGTATTTNPWQGSLGSSGTLFFGNLISSTFFRITCSNDSGMTISDSVSVAVDTLVRPAISSVISKEPGGLFIPGKLADVSGQGFLPTENMINIATSIDNPTTINTSSIDGNNMSFTVPALAPSVYNFWVRNWNGTSNYLTITIEATTTPVQNKAPTPPTIVMTQQVSALSSPCVSPSVDLKLGSRDAQTKGGVSILQKFLQEKNYLVSVPTGYFGALTQAGVKKFQTANAISPTGFVGPLTRAKIATQICKK